MNQKKINRIRRSKRVRLNIREAGKISLVVNKTSQHTYAQIISADGGQVLASASTLQSEVRQGLKLIVRLLQRLGRLLLRRQRNWD